MKQFSPELACETINRRATQTRGINRPEESSEKIDVLMESISTVSRHEVHTMNPERRSWTTERSWHAGHIAASFKAVLAQRVFADKPFAHWPHSAGCSVNQLSELYNSLYTVNQMLF